MAEQGSCKLADGFSLNERLWAQVSFQVMAIVGVVGIGLVDWRWMVPYLVLYLYGIPGVLMRHLSCPRCPHLYAHGDCVQFPPSWTRLLVKKRKNTPFSAVEKVIFYGILLLLPLYPLYWLWDNPLLLVVFILATIAWYLGQLMYFCKHCRVKQCPLNQAVGLDQA